MYIAIEFGSDFRMLSGEAKLGSEKINFSEKLSIRYNFQIIENMIDNSDTFSIVLDFNRFRI